MSVVCATLTGSWGSPVTVQLQSLASNPPDLSSCSYVFMTGGDYGSLVSQITTGVSLADLQNQVSNLQALVNPLVIQQNEPFDYDQAALFWGFAFTMVLTFWLVSHVAGLFVRPLKTS